MKHCYSRFDDGTYLQTCLKPKEHSGQHEGDNDSRWTDEQGWWDIYGDSPEKACARRETDGNAADTDGGGGAVLCLQSHTAEEDDV